MKLEPGSLQDASETYPVATTSSSVSPYRDERAPLGKLRNFLYSTLQRHSIGFGLGLGLLATVSGLLGGLLSELLLIGGVLLWLAWEARPNILFSLGLYRRSARAAHHLAIGAGPSLRGDVHRLTEAAALLTMGKVLEAKHTLAQVDPERLPPRGRFVHFLNLSALFCRLGDGESALAMVDASQAEVEEARPGWRALPTVNRSAALCELGRFEEAAACLEEIGESKLPAAAHSYYYNNLAWSLALGQGDRRRAVRLARRALSMRKRDPGIHGTLGVAMLIAGDDPVMALAKLNLALENLELRSPHGKGVVLAAAAYGYRLVGEKKRARGLEQQLSELPIRGASRKFFQKALERGNPAEEDV
jgi:tetratricopeptide (TPR) repeat protein